MSDTHQTTGSDELPSARLEALMRSAIQIVDTVVFDPAADVFQKMLLARDDAAELIWGLFSAEARMHAMRVLHTHTLPQIREIRKAKESAGATGQATRDGGWDHGDNVTQARSAQLLDRAIRSLG